MEQADKFVFKQALKDLAETLQQRENEGLVRFIEPDAPNTLRELAENLAEENIDETCRKFSQIISTLGETREGQMIDELENLQSIVYHLQTLRQNPIRSEGDIHEELSRVLFEKIQLMSEKADGLAGYLNRR